MDDEKHFQYKSKKYRKAYLDGLSQLLKASETNVNRSRLSDLCGTSRVVATSPKKMRKRASIKRTFATERQEQITFATWLTKNNIRFYAIPNGGLRNQWEGVKLKREGVQPGVPDICIPLPAGSHHGLYIELKRYKGGRLSGYQQEWLIWLRNHGYVAEVANGFEEAKTIVLNYLQSTGVIKDGNSLVSD